MPHTGVKVHLVHAAKEYVEHLFRESLKEAQLAALEKRRPRTFGGMGACRHRELTLRELKNGRVGQVTAPGGTIWCPVDGGQGIPSGALRRLSLPLL